MKHVHAIVALAALAIGSGHAFAQVAQDPGASTMVSYADLDLSSSGGRATLQARVHAAVDQVCPEQDARRLEMRGYYEACRAHAEASARDQIAQVMSQGRLAENVVRITAR